MRQTESCTAIKPQSLGREGVEPVEDREVLGAERLGHPDGQPGVVPRRVGQQFAEVQRVREAELVLDHDVCDRLAAPTQEISAEVARPGPPSGPAPKAGRPPRKAGAARPAVASQGVKWLDLGPERVGHRACLEHPQRDVAHCHGLLLSHQCVVGEGHFAFPIGDDPSFPLHSPGAPGSWFDASRPLPWAVNSIG
jgi:hypothetical protein